MFVLKNISKKLVLFLTSIIATSHAFALTIGEVSSKKSAVGTIFIDEQANSGINKTLTGTTKIIVAISVVVGFVFAAKGLHMLYEASQPQTQSTYAKGLVVLLVGGALVSLPWVVFTSSNTIQAVQT